MLKAPFRICAVFVGALIAVPAFAQMAPTQNFDPYAASDAKGNFLHAPVSQVLNNEAASPPAPVNTPVYVPAVVPNDNAGNKVVAEPRPTHQGPYTYENAPSHFAPITDRILADPTFLPLKGQVLGNTVYSYTEFREIENNAAGQKRFSEVERGNHFSQYLSYGVTDRLSIRASEEYTTSNDKERLVSGTTSRVDYSGFTNPVFGMTYRVLDQTQVPFLWDVSGFL